MKTIPRKRSPRRVASVSPHSPFEAMRAAVESGEASEECNKNITSDDRERIDAGLAQLPPSDR